MDIDGIYIGASPLGDNAGVDFHAVGESAVPAYLSLAANQLATSQSVDGSASRRCQEVFCNTVTASEEVGQFGMGLGLNPYEVESFLPFVQWGASRAWTFEYDSEEYSLDFIYTTFDDISSSYYLALAFFAPLPRSLIDKLAFNVDGTVFPLSAVYFDPCEDDEDEDCDDSSDYFLWEDTSLRFAEGDEIDVKLIETATVTFDAATYTADEGSSLMSNLTSL